MKISDSAFFLAGITAFLYCSSTAYTHGYFGVLGLDSDVLDRNFHQILYHGMIENLELIMLLPFIFICGVLFIYFYVTTLNPVLIKISEKVIKKTNLKNKRKERSEDEIKIDEKYERLLRKSLIFCFAFTVFFSIMIKNEREGRDAANNALKMLDDKSYHKVKIFKNGENLEFAFLYCGARNCAGIEPESREIIYFPQNGHSYSQPNEI
ncbi:hypothetical protein [Candidatus Sororendozoicomonas aggregata]|uniref:hypothetical protein n=1 Tax=Candidatus Sororendozoicomonas aggregata TaxID=3073239 RepID=UPI002ED1309C